MLKKYFLGLLMTVISLSSWAQGKVGLVLSGGGAKGIAHIGVIQALEENDIPIDYITGTSMGAIVGGLYACGYSPEEMMELLLSKDFSYWSTGRVNPEYNYFFGQPDASPTLFTLQIGKSAAADSVPASLISPQPMSFAFMELFSPYTAVCNSDFDRLFVPFHCVASDVAARHKHVFKRGRVGDAVRASMSFPIVFQPINIDGTLYYDGGIYDNFPVDVMREDFKPDIMIGVDVSSEDVGPQTTLMDQIDNLVIQNNNYDLPADEGIKMRLDLNEYALLDFPAAKAIYKVGYDYAMSMMDSIKARIPQRRDISEVTKRRSEFKKKVPGMTVGSVKVYGATGAQNRYIESLFAPKKGVDTISVQQARLAYYRAIGSDQLKDLFPQATYNPSSGMFDMTLKAYAKSRWQARLGGYITSSTGSYLYVSLNYSSLRFNRLNALLSAWVGQSNMAAVFDGRFDLHTHIPSAIAIQGVASTERYYDSEHLFFKANQPTFIRDHEYFGRLAWSVAAGRIGKIDIGAGYGALRYSYYRNNLPESYRDGRLDCNYALGEIFARFTSSTLNDLNYPTLGYSYNIVGMGVMGNNKTQSDGSDSEITTHPKWAQLEIFTRNYPSVGEHFSLGVETDFMLSTRRLLPTYSASIASAPSYTPTPASNNAFYPDFRANSFLAAGIVPVYRYNSNISARVGGYCFVPLRAIRENISDGRPVYGQWFHDPEFWAEAAVTYRFPFASLSGYVNYATINGDHWHVGITFGIYLLPPKFLR